MTAMQDVETVLGHELFRLYSDQNDYVVPRDFPEAAQRLAALVRELLPDEEVAKSVKILADRDRHFFDSVIHRQTVINHVLPTLLKLLEKP